MSKEERLELIGKCVKLTDTELDDEEVLSLYALVNNRLELNGFSVKKNQFVRGWCTDSKYDSMEFTVYTIHGNENQFCIEEHYEYLFDNGEKITRDRMYTTDREILRVIGRVLGHRGIITEAESYE